MSSWGNYDNAANTPLWSTAAVKVAPTTQNTANLFNNTTVGYWEVALPNGGDRLANVAVGVFGVDADEAQVDGNVHTGWVLRKTFTGGRANRTQEEVLVAMSTLNADAEDVVYKDTIITITSQPSNKTTTAGNAESTLFSVAATSAPTKTLSYQWQQSVNGGVSYANINPSGGVFTGVTTATLGVNAGMTDTSSTFNNAKFRCVVSAAGTGATATSNAGTLTVTP